jgi:Na+/H+-dicarboxylate symporter
LVDRLYILIRTHLWAQILVAMVLGIGTGLMLSPTGLALLDEPSARVVAGWLALPGQVFLALIQMIMIPLVMSSIILGISSSGDPTQLRHLGSRLGPYFLATTLLAVGLGATLVSWLQPGTYLDASVVEGVSRSTAAVPLPEPTADESLPDLIVRLIPTNPLDALMDERMLQVVVLAILLGIALMSIARERAFVIVEFTASVQELAMKVVSWAMLLAPAAVLSAYVGTVLLGLIALLVAYLVIVGIVAHRNPLRFLAVIRSVQLLAFSTSSSAAVMPLSMKTAEEELGVRPVISQFVVPLGATINMDGTALYQVVAAMFLLQVYGVDISGGQLGLLLATTIGASIGAPSTPGVGIVVLASVLQSVGMPATGLGLILGVDRILDMARTAVNVTGDLAACTVMERWLPVSPAAERTGGGE